MMRFTEFQDWKYTDNTTVGEIVLNNNSIIQRLVVELNAWRIIDQFTELRSPFPSVHTASRNLEIVSHAKILACD